MKRLILTLCLSLSLVSNIFSFDESLGLKGQKIDKYAGLIGFRYCT